MFSFVLKKSSEKADVMSSDLEKRVETLERVINTRSQCAVDLLERLKNGMYSGFGISDKLIADIRECATRNADYRSPLSSK